MEVEWIYIAITATGLSSGISGGFLKIINSEAISIDFRVRVKKERKRILLGMARSIGETKDSNRIKKILETNNAALEELEITENLISESSKGLMRSIYLSIIGFVLILAAAAIGNESNTYPIFVTSGFIAYLFALLCLVSGMDLSHKVHDKYTEMVIKSRLEGNVGESR